MQPQLDCRAEGNDEIMYRWTKDGNSIAAFKKSGLLEIAEVTKDDQGTYECLASNGAGSVSAPTKATLVIKGGMRDQLIDWMIARLIDWYVDWLAD